jgi:restriction endonuclease/AAA ATPase-like protein
MTTLTFDWSHFKGDGLLFQHLCRELFEAEGLHVAERAEGGSDRGRDLEVFLDRSRMLEGSGQPDWWIECKSRITDTVVPNDVSVNLAYAIIHHAKRLVFMTNSHLTNPARDIIRDFSRCTSHYFSTMTLQREDIEAWIASNPDIYDDYFVKTPPVPRRPRSRRTDVPGLPKPVDIEYWITSTFRDDDPHLIARARNFSFTEQQLRVDFGGTYETIRLDPFTETECDMPVSAGATLSPAFFLGDHPLNSHPRQHVERLLRRIDAVFVDPNRDVQQIQAAIAAREHVYVAGPAGLGKTRLIREAARACGRCITVDLSSENYGNSLAARLIAQTIGIDVAVLTLLATAAIESMLVRRGCDLPGARLVAALIKHESTDIDPSATISAILSAITAGLDANVIFLDNVHKFSAFDLALFRRLLQSRAFVVVCTARSNEFALEDAAETLHSLAESGEMVRLDLSPLDLQVRLSAFVSAAAGDGDTLAFLRKYTHVASFHGLLLQLKQLRMLKVLTQRDDGTLIIERRAADAPLPYRRVWDELLANLAATYESERVGQVLQLAAAWGNTFPDRLILDVLGGSTSQLIDRLVGDEIFVQKQSRIPNVVSLRFDHELTHEIVYGAMESMPERRMSFARTCIDFLRREGPSSPLFAPRLLSLQYERTADLPNATVYSNEEARRLISEGQLADASHQLEHSITLLDRLEEDKGVHEPALQTETLLQFIEVGSEVHGMVAVLPRMRQLATHLVIHPNELSQAALQEQFARHYTDQRQEQKALHTIDTALATYRRHGSMTAYGRALNTKGVLKKRLGHASAETLRVHREAIRILRREGDRRGEAEALGDLGAVLLENGRGGKTVFWWRKSMERLQGTLDYPAFCSHLTDYSYICALYRRDDAETETHLEAAYTLARRLGLTHLTCRTSINLANYLMVHGAPSDVARCETLLADALRLACADADTYLELLVAFTRVVLDHRIGRASGSDLVDRFNHLVDEECAPAWKDARSADNRLIHIGRYLALHQPERLVPAQIESPLLRSFLAVGSIGMADRLERENPYYHAGGFYATYY